MMVTMTVSVQHIPANDPGCFGPVSQSFLVISPAVVVIAEVCVRIDVSVIIMKP